MAATRPLPAARYHQLRVAAQVALGFVLFGAFALGFRMLGLPDLVGLALPQLHILQCVAYAIIVSFGVYLAVWEAVLRPLQRRRRRHRRMGEAGALLPLPSAADSHDRHDRHGKKKDKEGPEAPPTLELELELGGLPPQRPVLHWCNADPQARSSWERALASFAATARLGRADAQGRLALQSAVPQPYRDEVGQLRPARLQYRVELETGAWSAVRELEVEPAA